MDIFWNTIAAYNAATWPVQLVLVLVGAFLLVRLYHRPTAAIRIAMKLFMAFLNFWIAGVYYMVYCSEREYSAILTLFWAIMGGIWLYDLVAQRTPLERTGRHGGLALSLFLLPVVYPLCSLALGREFPMMTSPVMPCSAAIFTIGLLFAFSERVHLVLVMFVCHWALVGLVKVNVFFLPEDCLLSCGTMPALYVFFREYIQRHASQPTKPSGRVLTVLLYALSIVIGAFLVYTLIRQTGRLIW